MPPILSHANYDGSVVVHHGCPAPRNAHIAFLPVILHNQRLCGTTGS